MVPAYDHFPADSEGVIHRPLGLALPVAAFGGLPNGRGALVEGFGHLLRAVPRGAKAHGNHAVHAGEVGKRHVLTQVGIMRVIGRRGAGSWNCS